MTKLNGSLKLHGSLFVRDLELHVKLGWPDNERKQEQTVMLDVKIEYGQIPKACVSDNLDDTVCYSTLIETIREKIADKHFHLIEHLCHEIYHIMKSSLPSHTHIIVSITKHPKIDGLTGGVSFICQDENITW